MREQEKSLICGRSDIHLCGAVLAIMPHIATSFSGVATRHNEHGIKPSRLLNGDLIGYCITLLTDRCIFHFPHK